MQSLTTMGIFAFFLLCGIWVPASGMDEKSLVSTMLGKYTQQGVDGRPVGNVSAPIAVNISFSLLQILDFDQVNQLLTIVGWTTLEWVDELLTWNPSEHSGLKQIVLDSERIWTPDIILFNSVEPPERIHDTRALVGFMGNVTWAQECRYQVNCQTQPKDNTPTCELRFGSWAFDTKHLKLRSPTDRIDASFYVPHSTWELSTNMVLIDNFEFPHSPGVMYDDVTFEFVLMKRPEENEEDEEEKNMAATWTSSSYHVLIVSLVALLSQRELR